MDISFHEIKWRTERIGKRLNNEMVFEAQIHGMNINTPNEKPQEKELTEDTKKALDIALEQAKLRKAKQYGGKRISN